VPDLDVDIIRTSVIICVVMFLKSHLKGLYGLSEESVNSSPCEKRTRLTYYIFRKCSKFVPGKKSAVGDKPAIKRHQFPISWERLPFAISPLVLPRDLAAQRSTVNEILLFATGGADILFHQFLQIWNEDGVAAEPEDNPE
jgi:cohesin loading factor subunit SCC2